MVFSIFASFFPTLPSSFLALAPSPASGFPPFFSFFSSSGFSRRSSTNRSGISTLSFDRTGGEIHINIATVVKMKAPNPSIPMKA